MTRIGLRNLKTALAVFISMIIAKPLKLEFPFFVAIAAIISMDNSLMNSFKDGRSRIAGTFIGAMVGLICSLIRPGSAILCGVGLVAVIYLCNLLKWRKPVQIAGVVFMAIMVSIKGKSPLEYSFNRIIDTLLGIVIAVAVNYLICPPDYLPKLHRLVAELIQKSRLILERLLVDHKPESLDEYSRMLVEANELLGIICEDSKVRRRKDMDEITKNQKLLEILDQINLHLKVGSQLIQSSILDSTGAQEIQNLFGWKVASRPKEWLKEEDIILSYHLCKVIELYRGLDTKLRG